MNDKLREILNRVYGVYGTLNSADAIKEIEKSFLIIPKDRAIVIDDNEERLVSYDNIKNGQSIINSRYVKGKLYFITDEANR